MGHYFRFYASGNKVQMEWIQKGDVNGFFSFVRDKVNEPSSISQQNESKETEE